MAAVVEIQRENRRNAYRAKRTEAMPKHSLFGSALEIQDETGSQQLQNLDPKTVRVPKTPTPRGPGHRFVLPEDVKGNLEGAHVYENSKKQVNNQLELTKQVKNDLKTKEEEALYRLAQTGYDNYHPTEPGAQTARSQWFTQKDLTGAKDINIVGLNKNQSYNRDKYGNRAPVHNYSLIGDVLRPGMDFPRRERTEVQMRNLGYGKGDLRGALAEGARTPTKGNQSARTPRHTSVTLPPNIKHQFGSRVCDKLLADKDAVNKTIKDQKEINAALQRTSKKFDVPKFTKELNPEYEMLGNALRMNVVPGYTIDHKISTTKTAFNDQVHLFRHPDPDKYRYQKDELSTWSEQQVLWNRVAKSWRDYFGAQPTFLPVRSAPARSTRVATELPSINKEPKQRPPRRKAPKQTEKKKPAERKNSGFEDFKFETPPSTPPPEPSGNIPVNPGATRDDEFWKFYDKGKE